MENEVTNHFVHLKEALCSAVVLHFPYLSQTFEIESDASQYVIGVMLKQGGHPIAYHSETLSKDKRNYSTYDKEFYSLVQYLKQWCHYLLEKETILHTDDHSLIFINSQSKIEEQRHLKWASYIQQFHLVIRYKKGASNKMVDLLSRPPTPVLPILEVRCANYDTWKDEYAILGLSRDLGCLTQSHGCQSNSILGLHHLGGMALQIKLALCSTLI